MPRGSLAQDDEDETGRTPHRRVPARYVLRLGQVGGRYDNGGDYSDGDRSRDGNPGESLIMPARSKGVVVSS